ncbi:hypothetical protein [Trichoplusia ni single nucleopolyhedrovirus]|uniref:Uncharacterized protein n=1 Tax=Trichoplusia ni single nucleopolyhedrovirus TaxID=332054 RepID=Q461U5_9ABAC|nr:hypothetical protein TNSV_gp121 [Trichoplusia ni single nucleopolyhedrovirus]AAZ67491.1 hypothetical protein [Trichoplusia ni single nucleopolyhedrovirus]
MSSVRWLAEMRLVSTGSRSNYIGFDAKAVVSIRPTHTLFNNYLYYFFNRSNGYLCGIKRHVLRTSSHN